MTGADKAINKRITAYQASGARREFIIPEIEIPSEKISARTIGSMKRALLD
jgi:hypothetical protein